MRPLLCSLMLVASAAADVKLHPIFTDNMVLQRDAKVPIWGTADPGEEVKVLLKVMENGAIELDTASLRADDKGFWKATLNMPGAKPVVELMVKGKNNTLELKNVAVGDVWLCSGQSNMEWKVNQLTKDEQGKKVADNATNKNIRLYTVPNVTSVKRKDTITPAGHEGKWLECTPENVISFSAVGYFFGRDIQKSQNVPVGLIAADWGGTPCEAWTSQEGLEAAGLTHYVEALKKTNAENAQKAYAAALEKYKKDAEKAKAEGKKAPQAPRKPFGDGENSHTPTVLFNAMIAPIVPFPIKGAIWYQGESNASRAKEYRTLFPAMIADWRKQWGYDFPFFAVQLAPFQADGAEKVSYAELRDAQVHATKALPKVGIAIITDAGDEKDIHPQKKEPAGARLALAARAVAYGEKIEYSGPTFKEIKLDGNQAILTFDHLGGGLVGKGDALAGFTACGEDHVFHPAKAEIKGDTVVVTCEKVAKPVAVRFGWMNFAKPELNFFNKAGLPAVPFRTDDFPLTTR